MLQPGTKLCDKLQFSNTEELNEKSKGFGIVPVAEDPYMTFHIDIEEELNNEFEHGYICEPSSKLDDFMTSTQLLL